MVRMGGGTNGLGEQAGQFLDDREGSYEAAVYAVMTYRGSRWRDPDFGTFFIDAVNENTPEGIAVANTEAAVGLAGEDLVVQSITTTVSPHDPQALETTALVAPDDDLDTFTSVSLP